MEFAKDHELGATNATIFEIGFLKNGSVDLVGEEEVVAVVFVAWGAAAGGAAVGGDGAGGSESEGFDAFGIDIGDGVVVDADEEVGASFSGDGGLWSEIDELIGFAGHDDFESAGDQLLFEGFGEGEGVGFFLVLVDHVAGILAAVTWGDGDGADAIAFG